MEVSNSIIAVLLVLAIAVSAGNFFTAKGPLGEAISGMSVTAGKTNVSVTSQASITFVTGWNQTWFGQGTTNPGSSLVIATDQANTNSFYNGSYCNNSAFFGTGSHVLPMCIQNDGNDETTCVKIQASAAPTGWITCTGSCAQTPEVRIKAYENGTAGTQCTSGLRSTWGQLNATDRWLCEALNTTRVIGVDTELTLPQNTNSGSELSTTITITGSGSC